MPSPSLRFVFGDVLRPCPYSRCTADSCCTGVSLTNDILIFYLLAKAARCALNANEEDTTFVFPRTLFAARQFCAQIVVQALVPRPGPSIDKACHCLTSDRCQMPVLRPKAQQGLREVTVLLASIAGRIKGLVQVEYRHGRRYHFGIKMHISR